MHRSPLSKTLALVAVTILARAAILIESAHAASFVVPPDREIVRDATAIVIASALNSRSQLREHNAIETVTIMSVERVLKGSIDGDTFEIHEPGGVYEKRVTMIPGVPRFKDGDRYLLFLIRTGDVWRVLNLVLGKFTFQTDVLGHDVLMRDAHEIAGWDPDGMPHREQNRAAERFVDFVQTSASGGPAREEYLIPAEPIITPSDPRLAKRFAVIPLCASGCTPTSYTYQYSGSSGARWNSFPVNFFSTGANAAALTAMNNAIASWNNDASSNVTLVNAGADNSGTHTSGVAAPDGQNTVAFERNLTAEYGAPAFSCASMSYGGTLGIAAVTNDSGTHIGPNGETFFTAAEGDVEMNQGLSTCTFFINLGDFNSAVAHEIGHTLGFRHSDQLRNESGDCSSDSSLECSTSAIMKAFIPSGLNGALQAWDQHAVDAVYPNPTLAAPTNAFATAQTATSVLITWTAASGATSYHVYRTSNNSTYSLVGSPVGTSFTDSTASANTAYLYKVRSFNGSSESGDSNKDLATTVIFTDSLLTATVTQIKAVHVTEIRTAVNAVQTLVGTTPTGYTDPTLNTSVTVKKVHIDEPLTRLNAARTTAGLSTISLSGGSITQFVTAIRASDINDLRGGVQ